MDIIVFITTYNRSDELTKGLENLFSEKDFLSKNKVRFEVFDDGSSPQYVEKNKAICAKYGITYINNILRFGRFNFWRIHNRFIKRLSKKQFNYVFSLQDDFVYVKDFFSTSISLFETLKKIDDKCVCLNLMDNRIGIKCWTNFEPVILNVNNTELYKTGWTDCVYLADKKLFELLDYNLLPIGRHRWIKNPKKSSGVGEQISKRIFHAGYNFYQLKNPLISHIGSISKMNKWRNTIS